MKALGTKDIAKIESAQTALKQSVLFLKDKQFYFKTISTSIRFACYVLIMLSLTVPATPVIGSMTLPTLLIGISVAGFGSLLCAPLLSFHSRKTDNFYAHNLIEANVQPNLVTEENLPFQPQNSQQNETNSFDLQLHEINSYQPPL